MPNGSSEDDDSDFLRGGRTDAEPGADPRPESPGSATRDESAPRPSPHVGDRASGASAWASADVIDDHEPFTDGPVVVFRWGITDDGDDWPVEYVSPNVADILGYEPAELYAEGRTYADLIHDADLERVRREVHDNTIPDADRFHHDPYRLVTADGDVRWVLDHTTVVHDDDGGARGYLGYVVDITDQKRRENDLETLNEVADDLAAMGDADPEAILDRVVDHASDLLDAPAIAAHCHDDAGRLTPVVTTAPDALPPVEPGEEPVWDAFLADGPTTLDLDGDDPDYGDPAIGALLVVPIGERGALLVGATTPDYLDDHARDVTELLASTAAAAIDRAERTRALQKRSDTLADHAAELAHATALNRTVRSLQTSLVEANSRATIHETACRTLAELDVFDAVWIATLDADGVVTPAASTGLPESFVENVPLSVESDTPAPAPHAFAERDPVVIDDLLTDLRSESWRTAALEHGFRSVLAVPIEHDGVVRGALSCYSANRDAFDEETVEVLEELAALIGYALTAVERRNALHGTGDRTLAVRFDPDETDPFRRLAEALDTTIEIFDVSKRKRNSHLTYCRIPDATPDDVSSAADSIRELRSVTPVSDPDDVRYEVVTVDESLAEAVLALGATLHSLSVSPDDCELTVSVRRDRDSQRFMNQVRGLFGDATLVADHATEEPESMPRAAMLDDVLSDRQETVLKTAYNAGYFDEERKQTGTQIADALDIAQPTFSTHLRAAQYNLFSAIWDHNDSANETDR